MFDRSFEIELPAAAPFRLDLTAWALRRRAHNEMDRFDAGCWRREEKKYKEKNKKNIKSKIKIKKKYK